MLAILVLTVDNVTGCHCLVTALQEVEF